MSNLPSIVWFRQDLRTEDNPAFSSAVARKAPIAPLFIWSSAETPSDSVMGGASQWWLHHALIDLEQQLATLGLTLIIRQGQPLSVLRELASEIKAEAIFWNRCYDPEAIKRDSQIKERLKQDRLIVESFNGSLLYEPWQLQTKNGKPFQVFTPFWKTVEARDALRPLAGISQNLREVSQNRSQNLFQKISTKAPSLKVGDLPLLPRLNWADSINKAWRPTREAAKQLLDAFISDRLSVYPIARDHPNLAGTSRLSPYLHFGQISTLEVWYKVKQALSDSKISRSAQLKEGADAYLRQIVWREFAHHLLYHFPETINSPLQAHFNRFPWQNNAAFLKAWQHGRTGYPIVDAGMRELWTTGWMHNRVRLIAASFLVKDLLISWQNGASWFWDTLVDADLANNTLGWQWVAGCGADAAPYFRIFNPVLQGEKFDPNGEYVRKWVPELASVPTEVIHCPWKLSSYERDKLNYPPPLVDHGQARLQALAALKSMKDDSASSQQSQVRFLGKSLR